jgi:hypothetical protein
MDTGQVVVIGLCIFFGAWFLGGYVYNRRRGETLLSWIKPGLRQFGEAVEHLYPAAGQGKLTVEKPSPPFRKIVVVYRLETRENLPLWLYNHAKGIRDELLVRATLEKRPMYSIEAGLPTDPVFKRWMEVKNVQGFQSVAGLDGYEVYVHGNPEPKLIDCINSFLHLYPQAELRVSLQSKETLLIARAQLPGLLNKPAREFFTALADVVDSAFGKQPGGQQTG